MPRTIWSGAISSGLVTVPIHVVGATEDHSVRFHQVHLEDMARVRVRKYCELEGPEVTPGEIGKGYELSKDTVIAVSDEELQEMPLPTARAIEIEGFVPAESIDPIRSGGATGITGCPVAGSRRSLEGTTGPDNRPRRRDSR